MKTFKQLMTEMGAGAAGGGGGPTNVVGGVAGMGAQGTSSNQSEPGVDMRKRKKHNPILMKMGSRKAPK
jgi:hypothetical protein